MWGVDGFEELHADNSAHAQRIHLQRSAFDACISCLPRKVSGFLNCIRVTEAVSACAATFSWQQAGA